MKNQWIENNLLVQRYPLPREIELSDVDVYINVSDEYISYCHDSALKSGKRYFWFPLNECYNNMGLNSIYAAINILLLSEEKNHKVVVHCHAGVNRSRLVYECYLYFRTGTIPNEKSMLYKACQGNHLPSFEEMLSFIDSCKKSFELQETRRGGQLDVCIFESINK